MSRSHYDELELSAAALLYRLAGQVEHWRKKCHIAWEQGDKTTHRAMQAEAELTRLAGQVEGKDAALLACAKAIWPNYTLFNGTLEDSVPALIQELVKENAELREEVRLDHLAFRVVEDKLTAAQQQAAQAQYDLEAYKRFTEANVASINEQNTQAEAKGFERGVRAAMKLCSQSGELDLLDAIHCLLPKADK